MRRALLVSVLLLPLASCGFHLREEVALPAALSVVRLEVADPASPLARDLESALRRAGAQVTTTADAAAGIVRIPVNALTTEPLTVSDAARVQEYLVRYRVEVEVVDATGALVLARTPIELTRDYSYDETQALGAAAEEELLRRELQREMVQQVLRRIEAAGKR